MNGTIFEVVIVGAGPSGLMCSYYLKHLGLEHIIFDRGRLGESWRSQRWNSFRMITPFRDSLLPGALMKSRKPEAYGSAADMLALLQEYAASFQLPVTEQSRVLSVEKAPGSPVFNVTVLHDDETVRVYDAWQVIIAVGAGNRPFIPPIAASLPATLQQIHTADYRDANSLQPGGVLVVGGGQSGLEIAQDLLAQGREVWLSAEARPALPRYYRGKEIFQWMHGDRLAHRLPDAATGFAPSISYPLGDDHLLDRASLAARGVRMLGALTGINGEEFVFAGWSDADVRRAREASDAMLDIIDSVVDSIIDEQTSTPAAEDDTSFARSDEQRQPAITDVPLKAIELPRDDSPMSMFSMSKVPTGPVPAATAIHAGQTGISSIVWATGYVSSFPDVQLPAGGDQRVEGGRGITAVEGLYIVGVDVPANRDYVVSAKDDAAYVSNRIYGALR